MTADQENNELALTGYNIVKELGKGGMATVYLAKHEMLDRDVALKVLMFGASDETFRKSFISEARVIAKLEHPHIVKIYDIGIDNNQFYMAMELIRQGTLKEWLKKSVLSISEILNVIEQTAQALSYAHNQGYIHRDIKPANILCRDENDFVLADFGIAKLQGTDSDLTQMGYMSGTPSYMSPEQAMGEAVDARSDIYSLGIVLYEMLSGEKPYQGDNTVAITYKHAHEEIPKLAKPYAYLQEVIEKTLAKNKEDRYSNILAFSHALKQLVYDHENDRTVIVSTNELPDDRTVIRDYSKKEANDSTSKGVYDETGSAGVLKERKDKNRVIYWVAIPFSIISLTVATYFYYYNSGEKRSKSVKISVINKDRKSINIDETLESEVEDIKPKMENYFNRYEATCKNFQSYKNNNRLSAQTTSNVGKNYPERANTALSKSMSNLGKLCKGTDGLTRYSENIIDSALSSYFSDNHVSSVKKNKFRKLIKDCMNNKIPTTLSEKKNILQKICLIK